MPASSDRRQSPPDPSVTALRQVTGGRYTIIVNSDEFTARNVKMVGYDESPFDCE